MRVDRTKYLGGSDAAAIVGLDRWRSRHDVWLDKVGEGRPNPENERMLWGTVLESAIRKEYMRRTGRRVRVGVVRHPDYPFVRGHVDGLGESHVLEVKTAQDSREWADVDPATRIGPSDWTSIPPHYRPQVAHYILAAGVQLADVAVLLQGHDFRMYLDLPRPSWADELLAEEVEFWTDHVLTRIPPPIDGSEGSGRMLAARWPVDDGSELVALPHQYATLDAYRRARVNVEQAAAERDRLEQVIKEAMGEASYLLAPGIRISWKRSRDGKPVVDWEHYAAHLEGLLDMFESDRETIKGIYTTPGKPGSRRFLAKFEDPDETTGVDSPVHIIGGGATVAAIPEGSNDQ